MHVIVRKRGESLPAFYLTGEHYDMREMIYDYKNRGYVIVEVKMVDCPVCATERALLSVIPKHKLCG